MIATEGPAAPRAVSAAPRKPVPVPRDGPLPASFDQERLWLASRLDPTGRAYSLTGAMRLRGPLEVPALQAALTALFARHETLRTSFVQAPDRSLRQQIAAPGPVACPVIELPPGADLEGALRQAVEALAAEPFDLERGPLARFRLLRAGPEDHALLNSVHHAVLDIVSRDVFLRDLCALYESQLKGVPANLPPLAIQYADYAAWQRVYVPAVEEKQLGHWRQRLADVPAALALPVERSAGRARSGAGETVTLELDPALTQQLRALARAEGNTLYAVMLAAFQTLLHRACGADDLCVGTPVSARRFREVEPLIGVLMNTVAVRARFEDQPSFRELLKRSRKTVLEAFENLDVPFERVRDAVRGSSPAPLFQTWFFYQHAPPANAPKLGEAAIEFVENDTPAATYDLVLHVSERGAGLQAAFNYPRELFSRAVVESLAENFATLLRSVVEDPGKQVGALQWVAPSQQHRLLEEWGRGPVRPQSSSTLHAGFEAQVRARPSAEALRSGGRSVTYAALDRMANRLARQLVKLGARPDEPVVLCLERSLEAPLAMLAVLKTGAYFVPVDPSAPEERLAFMVRDTGAKLVLTQADWEHVVPPELTSVVVDQGWNLETSDATPGPSVTWSAEAVAYGIYTSGSTGEPKLALNTHRGIADRIESTCALFPLAEGDAVLQLIPLVFDVSVPELFWPLASGVPVVIAPPDAHKDPDRVRQLIAEERISVIHTTPALLGPLLAGDSRFSCATLRLVITGAEALSRDLRERVLQEVRELGFFYGPSETACHVTCWRAVRGHSSDLSPIGTPYPNTAVRVLDARLQPLPVGVVGELYVGGVAVGRGYHRRPALTAERFVPDPFEPGARLYRTGDLARFLPDGNLEFAGRRDDQVKVRGVRIELGELEAAIRACAGVREAAVIVREDAPGARRLVAYVSGSTEVAELRAEVARRVPDYMMPAAFVRLERLPLNANGKLDRKALPAPTQEAAGARQGNPPETAGEKALAEIFEAVLGVRGVHREDSFFDLGGDSLLSIEVAARAKQAGLAVSPLDVVQAGSLAELAARAETGVEETLQAEQGPVTGEVPLSPIQRWFFEAGFPNPSQYCIRPLVLDVNRPVATETLRRALAAVLSHHDSLRLRFERGPDGPWRQSLAPVTPPEIEVHALPAGDSRSEDEAVTRQIRAMEGRLDLVRGPVVRAAIFERASGAPRIAVVAHHLVLDAATEPIVLEDLAASVDAERPLPSKTLSFKAWSERLHQLASDPALEAELTYWTAAAARTASLPVDVPAGPGRAGSSRRVLRMLDAETSRAAAQGLWQRRRVHLHELLLAVLGQVVGRWAGAGSVPIEVTGHGRDPLFPGADVSRTTGWFSSAYPVQVGSSPSGPAVEKVAETLRNVPRRGAGYMLLRYLGRPQVQEALRALPTPQVAFNHLGNIDRHASRGVLSVSALDLAPGRDPEGPRSHLLSVTTYILHERLVVEWEYSADLHREETIERVADEMVAAVEQALRAEDGSLADR